MQPETNDCFSNAWKKTLISLSLSVQDPKMTDYKWEIKQRRKQKELFLNYRNVQPGDGNVTFDDRLRLQPSKNDVNHVFSLFSTEWTTFFQQFVYNF